MSRVQGTAAAHAPAASSRRWRVGAVAVGVLLCAGGAWWWSRPVEIDDEITARNARAIARLMEVQLDAELALTSRAPSAAPAPGADPR